MKKLFLFLQVLCFLLLFSGNVYSCSPEGHLRIKNDSGYRIVVTGYYGGNNKKVTRIFEPKNEEDFCWYESKKKLKNIKACISSRATLKNADLTITFDVDKELDIGQGTVTSHTSHTGKIKYGGGCDDKEYDNCTVHIK